MSDNPLGLDETKPEIPGEESQEGIYKENTSPNQGEYHQSTNEEHQSYWQNDYSKGTYQENPYGQTCSYQEPYQPVSQGFGIASMVLGIISLVLFCSCVNIPLAILAIIFGIIQMTKPESKKGMAIAGLITSALSILLFVVFTVTFLISADFKEGFQNGLNGDFPNYRYEYNFPDYDDGYNHDYEDDYDHDHTFDYDDFFNDNTF